MFNKLRELIKNLGDFGQQLQGVIWLATLIFSIVAGFVAVLYFWLTGVAFEVKLVFFCRSRDYHFTI